MDGTASVGQTVSLNFGNSARIPKSCRSHKLLRNEQALYEQAWRA